MDRCTQLLEQVQQEIDAFSSSNEMNGNENDIGIVSPPTNDGQTNIYASSSKFTSMPNQGKRIDDVAIVQSFYGTDVQRIEATTRALNILLRSTSIPSEWIFVEGQRSKSDACFQWLKHYGVTYVFVKTTKEQDGIFLKTPLWNIGTMHCVASKLCFIDSDVVFESPTWLDSVVDEFQNADVMSIGGYCAYEQNDVVGAKSKSIGLEYKLNGKLAQRPHSGFTIGMSRNVFNRLSGFDACIILDDIWNWARIFGMKNMQHLHEWIPVNLPKHEEKGCPVKLGATEETCIHLYHGDTSSRKYGSLTEILSKRASSLQEVISYSKKDFSILPTWNLETPMGRIAKKCVHELMSKTCDDASLNGEKTYFEHAKEEYGPIDANNPLIICTTIQQQFGVDAQDVDDFYNRLIAACQTEFTFVAFSEYDYCGNGEYDVIPLSKSFDEERPWMECFRKDVKFDKVANVLYFNFDMEIPQKFETLNVDDGIFVHNDNNSIAYFKSNLKTKSQIYAPIGRYLHTIQEK